MPRPGCPGGFLPPVPLLLLHLLPLLLLLLAENPRPAGAAERQWVFLERIGTGENQRTVLRRPGTKGRPEEDSPTTPMRAPGNQTTPTQRLLSDAQRTGCLGDLVGNTSSPFSATATSRMLPKTDESLISREQTLYRHRRIPARFRQPCFSSCALVGSAGVLSRTGWGRVIDSHEAVFRMNNAPTFGHERDVGIRTTVRVSHDVHVSTSSMSEYLLRTDPGGLILAWPPLDKTKAMPGPMPNVANFRDRENVVKILKVSGAPVLLTRMSLPAYKDSLRMARDNVGPSPPYVPSTGWFALYSALHMCREVHTYGFGWALAEESMKRGGHSSVGAAYYFWKHHKGNRTEDEYYDTRNSKYKMSFHGMAKEKEAMRNLAKVYRIHFH